MKISNTVRRFKATRQARLNRCFLLLSIFWVVFIYTAVEADNRCSEFMICGDVWWLRSSRARQ